MNRNTSTLASVFLTIAAAVAVFTGPAARAQIAGFGNGSNYTLNGRDQSPADGSITNSNDPPTISNGTLTITTDMGDEARSAFYNTQQNIASFTASFTFQDNTSGSNNLGAADGFAFVVQTEGLHALGGDSSGLGYGITGSDQPSTGSPITAITPSTAEEFYLRNGTGATDLSFNDNGSFANATSTSPVDLADGDPISVTLVYNDTLETFSETLVDLTTGDRYTNSRSADITGALNSSTAYVGFTGGTGGAYSVQTISNFTFTPGVPEPTSLGLLGLGAIATLGRRRRA